MGALKPEEGAAPPEVPPVEVRPEDPSPMQPPFTPGVGA